MRTASFCWSPSSSPAPPPTRGQGSGRRFAVEPPSGVAPLASPQYGANKPSGGSGAQGRQGLNPLATRNEAPPGLGSQLPRYLHCIEHSPLWASIPKALIARPEGFREGVGSRGAYPAPGQPVPKAFGGCLAQVSTLAPGGGHTLPESLRGRRRPSRKRSGLHSPHLRCYGSFRATAAQPRMLSGRYQSFRDYGHRAVMRWNLCRQLVWSQPSVSYRSPTAPG